MDATQIAKKVRTMDRRVGRDAAVRWCKQQGFRPEWVIAALKGGFNHA